MFVVTLILLLLLTFLSHMVDVECCVQPCDLLHLTSDSRLIARSIVRTISRANDIARGSEQYRAKLHSMLTHFWTGKNLILGEGLL